MIADKGMNPTQAKAMNVALATRNGFLASGAVAEPLDNHGVDPHTRLHASGAWRSPSSENPHRSFQRAPPRRRISIDSAGRLQSPQRCKDRPESRVPPIVAVVPTSRGASKRPSRTTTKRLCRLRI